MHRYFVIYKPYKMISQFVSPYEHTLLGDLNYDFPEGTHAVGRLDEDSEGLLILTTDKSLTRRLLHPEQKHRRSYLVQVEWAVTPETIRKLAGGLEIPVKKKGPYTTLPCEVSRIDAPEHLPPRAGYKEYIPHTWLEFVLTEGKNRQIRKMCSAVRHECKRLIRTKIGNLELGSMQPGQVVEIEPQKLFELIGLKEELPLKKNPGNLSGTPVPSRIT